MNKKGIELTFNAIAIAVIVFIVLVVLILTFTNIFGKQRGFLQETMTERLGINFDEEKEDIIIPLISLSFLGIINLLIPEIKTLHNLNYL